VPGRPAQQPKHSNFFVLLSVCFALRARRNDIQLLLFLFDIPKVFSNDDCNPQCGSTSTAGAIQKIKLVILKRSRMPGAASIPATFAGRA
jgi:hypothetical protein